MAVSIFAASIIAITLIFIVMTGAWSIALAHGRRQRGPAAGRQLADLARRLFAPIQHYLEGEAAFEDIAAPASPSCRC